MDEGFEQQIKNALADPELMRKVSGVLSSLGAGGGTGSGDDGGNGGNDTAPAPVNPQPLLPSDDRTRLLMAIKPFLSEKRAPYMDSAINILKLVSIGKIGKDLKLF